MWWNLLPAPMLGRSNERPAVGAASPGSTAEMKNQSIFKIIRAAVVVGALVGALAAPGATVLAGTDSDHDGLTNSFEKNWSHTNPFRADTNHNGINDGREN